MEREARAWPVGSHGSVANSSMKRSMSSREVPGSLRVWGARGDSAQCLGTIRRAGLRECARKRLKRGAPGRGARYGRGDRAIARAAGLRRGLRRVSSAAAPAAAARQGAPGACELEHGIVGGVRVVGRQHQRVVQVCGAGRARSLLIGGVRAPPYTRDNASAAVREVRERALRNSRRAWRRQRATRLRRPPSAASRGSSSRCTLERACAR